MMAGILKKIFMLVMLVFIERTKPPPSMVYSDPETGNDHSLKEVSACFIW